MEQERERVERIARAEGTWPCLIIELGSGAQHTAYLLCQDGADVVVRVRRGTWKGRERDALVAEYEALGQWSETAGRATPGFLPRHYRWAEPEPGRFHTVSEYLEPGVPLETQPPCAIETAGGILADRFHRLAAAGVPSLGQKDGRVTWSAVAGLGSDGKGGPLAKLSHGVQVLRPAWAALGDRFGVTTVNALSQNIRLAAATLRASDEEHTLVNVDLNPEHFIFARDGDVRLLDPDLVIGTRNAALAQCAFATGWLWRAIYHAGNPPLADRADALALLAGAYLRALNVRLSADDRARVSAHIFVELLDRARGLLLHAAGHLSDADARHAFDPGLCFERYAAGVLGFLWRYRMSDGFPSDMVPPPPAGTRHPLAT